MKLQFKNQAFQEAATAAVCDVFEGQPYQDPNVDIYTVDPGKVVASGQLSVASKEVSLPGFATLQQGTLGLPDDPPEVGYKNAEIELPQDVLRKNLHAVQDRQNLEYSMRGGGHGATALPNGHVGRMTLPDGPSIVMVLARGMWRSVPTDYREAINSARCFARPRPRPTTTPRRTSPKPCSTASSTRSTRATKSSTPPKTRSWRRGNHRIYINPVVSDKRGTRLTAEGEEALRCRGRSLLGVGVRAA